jgi:uncharacterized Tic20 family protein
VSEFPNEPNPYAAPPPVPNVSGSVSQDARTWAMICHLSSFAGYVIPVPGINILAPFLVWNLKKDSDPFIDVNGKEAINFNITWAIAAIVSGLSIFCVVGIALLPIVIIAGVVLVIIATIKASSGEIYKYPLTIRFMK